MIDLKHEARNFAPMNLPESADESFDEDVRWAYSLYNKTLQYIRKGYDDLARQNLKKAIGLYPDFYPARMLLGVCLFANGDRVGAMRMFNAIRDMQYKRLALSYYDYLAEEVDKPVSQSGTRLILKDLYKAAAASSAKLSDITQPVKPRNSEESSKNSSSQPGEDAGLESLTMGDISFGDVLEDKEKVEVEAIAAETEYDSETENPSMDKEDDFEIPKFITEKRQTLITSRKNDGVVEEIVKQKLEEAQKAARYSGKGKKPFSYNQIYKKKVFSDKDSTREGGETTPKDGSESRTEPTPRDNIVISVASIIILIFIIIVSVSLMSKISENRKLKNELDDLKKLYAQSQAVSESDSVPQNHLDSPTENPGYTPFSTSDPTPVATEVPTPTIAPAATPAATPEVN